MKFFFSANAAMGEGLSGSDRIFIELSKRWAKKGHSITIGVWEDGYAMCNREGLTEDLANIQFAKWFIGPLKNTPFVINYIIRVLSGIYFACTRKYDLETSDAYIYSCSDFWQDALPALILKMRYPKAKLIGSFYLAAPNPLKGFSEQGQLKLPSLKGTLYFLQQQPIYWSFKTYAEYIFVTSEPDISRFPKQSQHKRCVVVRGGVDLDKVQEWNTKIGNTSKIYDAVFLGRFHQQKGVVQLIDIWKKVVEQKPDAKLVMMGDGPLMQEVQEKIKTNNINNNVIVTGYVFDGEEKYRYFAQSKIAVHPAVYDSGGMAIAEALAWGLPGIAFDLEALKTYYPKGVIKILQNDNASFAKTIIALLNNPELYNKTKNDALDLIQTQWSWNQRADTILYEITANDK